MTGERSWGPLVHAVVHLENLHFALFAQVVALGILHPGARAIRRKALIRWELVRGLGRAAGRLRDQARVAHWG